MKGQVSLPGKLMLAFQLPECDCLFSVLSRDK